MSSIEQQTFTPVMNSRLGKLEEDLHQVLLTEKAYLKDKEAYEKNLAYANQRLAAAEKAKIDLLAEISLTKTRIEQREQLGATLDQVIALRGSATFLRLPRGVGKTDYIAKLGADIRKGKRNLRLLVLVANGNARNELFHRMKALNANNPVDHVQIYTVKEVEDGTCYALPPKIETDHTVIILDSIGAKASVASSIVSKFVSHNTGTLQLRSVSAIFLDSPGEA